MKAAGIDVGACEKGFHIVILEGSRAHCFHRATIREVVFLCNSTNVVAIDAPCGWACKSISPTGRSRQAERDLKSQRGIQSFYTPTRSQALNNKKSFYDWMFNGERIWRAFHEESRRRPLHLLETFPHGIACALRGQIIPAKNKRRDRSQLVKKLGYRLEHSHKIDYLDAALCAHAAICFAQGRTEEFGNPTEGKIFLPKWSQ